MEQTLPHTLHSGAIQLILLSVFGSGVCLVRTNEPEGTPWQHPVASLPVSPLSPPVLEGSEKASPQILSPSSPTSSKDAAGPPESMLSITMRLWQTDIW